LDLNEIEKLPNGARFYRCDLHVHSYGGSHDVHDTTMTPEAIVQTAVQENLAIIAITDHNEINNIQRAIDASMNTLVTVVPGVELSTPQGHLLCYFPNVQALQQFHGRLQFADRQTANSRCNQSMFECLEECQKLKGFCVLAHVDSDKGFEKEVPGASPHKTDVIAHQALLGIELKQATSDVSYSEDDPDIGRKNMGGQRVVRLNLGLRQFLARVMNSDAHSLDALGKNAQGDRRVTRVKMNSPSFSALRLGLEDAEARVRIEAQIPYSVPHVIGVHMEAGFVADQTIHLSPNLNCIIGGRGTGKSTSLEAIRCLSREGTNAYMVDTEVWPTRIDLFWRDQAGHITALTRPIGGEVENVDDPFVGPTSFEVECFGQGEATKISESAKESPLGLLKYLDTFIDFGDAVREESEARDALLNSQNEIEKATQQADLLPVWKQSLTSTQAQIAALEKANAKEVLGLQRHLAAEKQTRVAIQNKVKNIKQNLAGTDLPDEVTELCELGDVTSDKATDELKTIHNAAVVFSSDVELSQGALEKKFLALEKTANDNLAVWRSRDSAALAEIEEKRKALEAQGIKLDMAYIQKLAKDEAQAKQNIATTQTWGTKLKELQRERIKLLKARWSARQRIATLRTGYAAGANATLKSALSDLQVSLKFSADAYSPNAEAQIVQAMGWRTVQVPRANVLVQQLTVPKLLEAIEKNDTGTITALQDGGGATVFDKHDAQQIIGKLREVPIRFALERVAIDDLPKLTVTKMIGNPAKPVSRDFSRLSLGQQQSVLLALVLSSKSKQPLIIDQPEDNLDSEFISSTLVPVLRRAKERRQIIIVTHNANIAILSDAEQIIVLKSNSERAQIAARGSIDDPITRDSACNILEGSKEAFNTRAKIYGIR
jgi:ABC-type lipoprotein export system ATPase subunit